MKLKQEKMLSASPKTIDITWFLKKSCIAIRTIKPLKRLRFKGFLFSIAFFRLWQVEKGLTSGKKVV